MSKCKAPTMLQKFSKCEVKAAHFKSFWCKIEVDREGSIYFSCNDKRKFLIDLTFRILFEICTGASQAPKLRGTKSQILPHFSKNLSCIAFFVTIFWISQSQVCCGPQHPLDPQDTKPLNL